MSFGVNKMEKVNYTSDNGISTITFNRPESYNALDVEMLKQLEQVLDKVEKSTDDIVILTGEGRAFCAGGDIGMMSQMAQASEFDELMNVIENVALKLYLMPKIIISAVNGSAAGLGLSIALNADYIVANETTRFGMLFAGIGLIPDGGGHFFLQQRVGTHKAKQFIWGLKQISGQDATEFGFVDIMTDKDVKEAAIDLAAKLQASPLRAIIETRQIYHEKNADELRHYLAKEKEGQLKMRNTADHHEGVEAFLAKKKPNFKGI